MFRTLIATLPLLAATTTAQIETADYGRPGKAMTLELDVEAAHGVMTLRTEGGVPGVPVAILVGRKTEIDLSGLGIDGYLLVMPFAATPATTTEDTGRSETQLSYAADLLRGQAFYMQAVSFVGPNEEQPAKSDRSGVELSNGCRVAFAD